MRRVLPLLCLAAVAAEASAATFVTTSVEEATRYFEERGLQEHANAEREARRGASDPMYLVYTLGKMQILHLLEECREAWGGAFTLKAFHHRLLATGYPPMKLARLIVLGKPR